MDTQGSRRRSSKTDRRMSSGQGDDKKGGKDDKSKETPRKVLPQVTKDTFDMIMEEAIKVAELQKFLVALPENYSFQNKTKSGKQQLLTKDGKIVPKSNFTAPPDTKEYYDKQGSIKQPNDGPNTKAPGKKCLTCISQGSSCHGTEVKDGKCDTCRGKAKSGAQTARTRDCKWQVPASGVYTYKKHQEVFTGRTIPENTAAARQEGAEHYRHIFDWPAGYERRLLTWLAEGAWATTVVSPFSTEWNSDVLWTVIVDRLNGARSLENRPAEIRRYFGTVQTHQNFIAALTEMRRRLEVMRRAGLGVTIQEIQALLPNDHPQKNEDFSQWKE